MKKLYLTFSISHLFILLIILTCSSKLLATAKEENNQRILIVYFSQPERVTLNGVDAVSGASLLSKNNELFGSNHYVARLIQQNTKGELFRIETVSPYPTEHELLLKYAENELKNNARPQLKNTLLNIEDYDVIFLGYPIWWYKMPMPLYSFLEQYNLSGKTVIPFTVHGGSRFSDSMAEIRRLQPNANLITRGLAISRNDVADNRTVRDVNNWLKELGHAQ